MPANCFRMASVILNYGAVLAYRKDVMIHFGAHKLSDEAGRVAALRRYELLDTEDEPSFEATIDLVKLIFKVPIAAISLIDEDRQWFKASRGLEVRETPRSVAFCHYTTKGNSAFSVNDATRDTRFSTNPLVTGAPGIRCYLGVPLTTPDGYNVGSLCIIGTEPRGFSQGDKDILHQTAQVVVSQFELRTAALRDTLTGAISRQAFEDRLRAAWDRAQASDHPASLLLVDIDHLKSLNDRFGHPTGDAVIRAVGDAIRRVLRSNDVLARLGGEEFAVLLDEVQPTTAWSLAEQIRQTIADLTWPYLLGRTVTVSCGLAHWSGTDRGAAEWLAVADAALSAAKRSGRNRTRLAPQV